MSVFGRKASGLRLERMQSSPRFRDGVFHNATGAKPELTPDKAFSMLGEIALGRHARRRPVAPLPALDPREAWTKRVDTGLRATWLGHSTLLLEIDGVTVLTDPVWNERASPASFAGPKRFQPVPVTVSALPKLDAVVISHDHYDHLDFEAIAELKKRDVTFYTSLGVGLHLEAWGVSPERIVELDWWESVRVPDTELTLTFAPSQHFSGRGVAGRNHTLWSSIALTGPKHRVFFSGDTGLTPEYAEIRERLGPFDLVMLEVGAFHPNWGTIHLGPENALEAHALLGGGPLLPIHWGTFDLALHDWDEPAETLVKLAPARNATLVMPRLGEPVEPARVEGVEPWWRSVGAEVPREMGDPGHAHAPVLVEPVD